MIAATLGPVASAFSICALGSKWRLHIAPGQKVEDATYVDDPAWYVALAFTVEALFKRRLTVCLHS